MVNIPIFLPTDKLLEIQQLAPFLFQIPSVSVHQVISFWERPNFVPVDTI